jgi:ADP-heptose:LPS heptosyltransferase
MGIGDQIMGSGMARGASSRGKRVAFGEKGRIIWDQHSEMVFRGNPNIAPPGTEQAGDLEWIPFFKGNRLYNHREGDRWVWNLDFHATPGELCLSREEKKFAREHGRRDYVVIEPNVPAYKSVAANKQWPVNRYAEVATQLKAKGYHVVQFYNGKGFRIPDARAISTPSFRLAAALLARAALYIGAEGGLHHAAAALNIPGVVLFGGFIPPSVTGYASHTNLTGGADACGSLLPCKHCKMAMDAISTNDVTHAAQRYLTKVEA